MDTKNSKKQLLIIDDEANMRHMLSTVLKKADLVELCVNYAETMKPLYQWLSKLNRTVSGAK